MSLKEAIKGLMVLLMSVSLGVSAQEQVAAGENGGDAGAEPAKAKVVTIEEQTVNYLWYGHEKEVFGGNGWGKWRHFMHGQTDENGAPLLWSRYFPAYYEEHSSSQRVVNAVMSSDLYSLELSGKSDIVSDVPIVEAEGLNGHQGGCLRLHVWISGDGTGESGTLWESAPQVSLILMNQNGTEMQRSDGRFRTRGTYRWFCYYVDMFLPENLNSLETTGIFVRLANPVSGKAYFCTPSVEWLDGGKVSELKGGLPASYADPKRGTFAPNPDNDEMPMNFFFGLPSQEGVVWQFIEGNYKTASLALSYNLEEYIDAYKDDWFHCTYAFPNLLQLYTVGVKAKRVPQLQQDWGGRLVDKLESMQDKKTGLWAINGVGNLPMTYFIATRCFAPTAQQRSREALHETPWNSVGGRQLNHATELAMGLLSAQKKDAAGAYAGWNKYAFQGGDLESASRDAVLFDCESSAMAVSLLSQCRPLVGSGLQAEIDDAVQGAYTFAMSHILSDRKCFFEDERQKKLCSGPWDYVFWEGTQALDMKLAPTKVSGANVDVSLTKKGDAKVTVHKFADGNVSVRVYGMVEGQDESSVHDASLLGIIRNKAVSLRLSDPLLIMQAFCDAHADNAAAMTAEEADAAVMAVKAKILESVYVKDVQDGEFAVLEIPDVFRKGKLMVVSADGYGNLSAPLFTNVP